MPVFTNGDVSVTIEGGDPVQTVCGGYVMVSAGAVITAAAPAPSVDARGVLVDGHQIGCDAGPTTSSLMHEPGSVGASTTFTNSSNADFPITLSRENRNFVKIKSQTTHVPGYEAGIYTSCIIVVVVDSAKSSTHTPPAFLKRKDQFDQYHSQNIDVASFAASLPKFSGTGIEAPTTAHLLEKMGQPTIFPMFNGVSFRRSAPSFPLHFGAEPVGPAVNYGGYMATTYDAAFLKCLLTETSVEDREALLRRMITAGRQYFEGIFCSANLDELSNNVYAGPSAYRANGGIAQYRELCVLVYLASVGSASTFNEYLYKVKPNIYGHYGELWTQKEIDDHTIPHNSLRKPDVTRVRDVISVNNSGSEPVLTLQNRNDKISERHWNGSTIYRVSDGASAQIKTLPLTSGNHLATVFNHPVSSPFIAGDVVYVVPAVIPAVGSANYWFQRFQDPTGYEGLAYETNWDGGSGRGPRYYSVQNNAGMCVAASVFGIAGGRMAAAVDVTRRALRGDGYKGFNQSAPLGSFKSNNNTPSAIDSTFWSAHKVALGLD